MIAKIFSLFSALSYLSISCYLLYALIKRYSLSKSLVLIFCSITLVIHVLTLGLNFSSYGGANVTLTSGLSFVMALIISVTLVLSIKLPVLNSLIIWFPLTAISVLIAQFVQPHSTITLKAGILLHVTLSLLAYVLLAFACILALLLLWQDYQLKHKHLNRVMPYFPPLQTMERILFIFLCNSWIFLSLSLVSGWFFLENLQLSQFISKTIGACGAWLIFAVFLVGSRKWGWRGSVTIKLTLSATLLLGLASLVSHFY